MSATGDNFVVVRYPGRISNLIADCLRLPRAGKELNVRLEVFERDGVIVWKRTVDGKPYPETSQWVEGNLLCEKAGPATYVFELRARDDAVVYNKTAFRLFGVKMPKGLSMHVWAKVDPTEDGWRIKVAIRGPLGRLCRYAGNMRAE